MAVRNKPTLVALDLAGTTIQDHGEVAEAFTTALSDHGITVPRADVEQLRGRSKREAIEAVVAGRPDRGEVADAVYRSFSRHLSRLFVAFARPVDGAETVIRTLRANGFRVAFNTGFDREATVKLLECLGWSRGLVDAVICGDDVSCGRPAPYLIFRAMEATRTTNVLEVVNVGDTISDLLAGWNAGVGWNVGVLSGAHDATTLARAAPSHVIATIGDLPSILMSE